MSKSTTQASISDVVTVNTIEGRRNEQGEIVEVLVPVQVVLVSLHPQFPDTWAIGRVLNDGIQSNRVIQVQRDFAAREESNERMAARASA